MPYLFDTDAISETLKKKPSQGYLRWLRDIPRREQFASAISIGELYKGAFASPRPEFHLQRIEGVILPALLVLPYDGEIARVFGELQASLSSVGKGLADADLQIAATAIWHGMKLVTGNLKHFRRIPGLKIETILADTRVADLDR